MQWVGIYDFVGVISVNKCSLFWFLKLHYSSSRVVRQHHNWKHFIENRRPLGILFTKGCCGGERELSFYLCRHPGLQSIRGRDGGLLIPRVQAVGSGHWRIQVLLFLCWWCLKMATISLTVRPSGKNLALFQAFCFVLQMLLSELTCGNSWALPSLTMQRGFSACLYLQLCVNNDGCQHLTLCLRKEFL